MDRSPARDLLPARTGGAPSRRLGRHNVAPMTPFAKIRLPALVALLAMALAAAGCGSNKKESLADKSAAKAEQEAKSQQPIPEPAAVSSPTVSPTAGEADINK